VPETELSVPKHSESIFFIGFMTRLRDVTGKPNVGRENDREFPLVFKGSDCYHSLKTIAI